MMLWALQEVWGYMARWCGNAVAKVETTDDEGRWREVGYSLRSAAERALFLDAVSQNLWLMLQFVDDSFVAQSTLHGLRCANRALTDFCHHWKHRFKLGAKGPTVLAVGANVVADDLGDIQGSRPEVKNKMQLLGVWIDSRLTLQDQLDMVCAKLLNGSKSLVRAMNDLGFGMPFQVFQLKQRVWASAFHGAEVLASYGPGWKHVVKRLNDTHYAMAKTLLGLPPTQSLGIGGYVRAFSETRFLTRLGAELTQRVVMARVRLLLLPPGHPMEVVLKGIARVPGRCWLRDVETIMDEMGIGPDIGEGWDQQDRTCRDTVKNKIK